MIRLFVAALAVLPALSFGQSALTAPVSTPVSPVLQPITSAERWKWFEVETAGPTTLAAGLLSAGWGTLRDNPREYGPHWDGFGQRYGMRLTGISTGNAMEAGLGALWGEDPRYNRVEGESVGRRLRHVVAMTFMAPNGHGGVMPAYARYVAIPGNNFLSNTWREPSEATNGRALFRTGLGFLSRMTGNAYDEFWPDIKRRLFHH